MSVLTQIIGDSWATSGAATAGSTGFASTTLFTHVPWSESDPAPIGCNASGYLDSVVNTAPTFKMDADGVPWASDPDYWVKFYIRPKTDFVTINATTGKPHALPEDLSRRLVALVSGSTYMLLSLKLSTSKSEIGVPRGFLFDPACNFTMSPLGTVVNLRNTYFAEPTVPLNEWTEITFHVRSNATAGILEMYQNGVLIVQLTGADTKEYTDLSKSFPFVLSATTGIKWQITGPLESWIENDIVVRPRYDLIPTGSLLQKYFPINRWLNLPQGSYWSSVVTGTGSVTITNPGAGVATLRHRLTLGANANDTIVLKSYDKVGTPVYNSEGWFSIVFNHIYKPGTSTFSLRIRNDADDADLIKVDVAANGTISVGGVTKATLYSIANRVTYILHFSQTGEVRYTLLDKTDLYAHAASTQSGILGTWIPADIGVLEMDFVRGDANIETEGAYVASWVDLAGVDSLTCSNTDALSPIYCDVNNVTMGLPHGEEPRSIPGGIYQGLKQGLPLTFVQIFGVPGRTRDDWTTLQLPGLADSRGIRVIFVDGGSINDIATITDAASAITVVAQMSTQLETAIQQLTANKNRVWLTTMLPRVLAGYTATQLAGLDAFNEEVRRLATTYDSDLLEFSDIAGDINNPQECLLAEGTHPSAYGNMLICRYMYAPKIKTRLTAGTRNNR